MFSPILFRYSKPSSCLVFLFLFFSYFHHFPCTLSQEEPGLCKDFFSCGNITAGFPFWGDVRPELCGHPSLGLRCDPHSKKVFLIISDLMYHVLEINSTLNTLRLARQDYLGSFCSASFSSATLTPELFEILPDYTTLSVHYLCNPYFHYQSNFTCPQTGIGSMDQNDKNPIHCPGSFNINVPLSYVPEEAALDLVHLESVLEQGFLVKLKIDERPCKECQSSGGFCNYRDTATQVCCKINSSEETNCLPMFPPEPSGGAGTSGQPRMSHDQKQKLGIGLASGLLGFILIAGSLYCFIIRRRKKLAAQYTSKDLPVTPYSSITMSSTQTSTTVSGSNHSLVPSISNLANGSVYFGVQVFSYEELEEATDNFSKELGDGGFGTVYYGLLKDGRAVAVKKLFERSLKRVEQFKNEIEILKSLKHPNLVILYGCTSRHSRELLLVYEYISNGTLAEHLHGNHAGARPLCWPTRLNIAIQTASALSFLHASGIIHRDVKTTNILLDSNYEVKVADFGLSRLFPTDQTHISTAPQGTPGYVDPEYYQCYRLNEKSDVYSFGVVLAELISSKEAVDITRHRHDINLANMAITKIQNNAVHELADPKLGFARDPNVKRMMMSVAELAFRCLQQEREVRPSMDEILEVLQSIKDSPEEVVDIDGSGGDGVGLPKDDAPPPLSPETDKWMSSSSTTGSSL